MSRLAHRCGNSGAEIGEHLVQAALVGYFERGEHLRDREHDGELVVVLEADEVATEGADQIVHATVSGSGRWAQ
jgi:hypothetical protein